MKRSKRIFVTKNIIQAANKLIDSNDKICAGHCPVSLALSQQSDYSGWFVTEGAMNGMNGEWEALTMTNQRFTLPKNAVEFLKKWGINRNRIVPFSFLAPSAQTTIDF